MTSTSDHDLPAVATNPRWSGYRCMICGHEYDTAYAGYVCADCGIDGILDVVYDGSATRPTIGSNRAELWDFATLLPVIPAAAHAAWSLGGTPLWPAPRLAARLGQATILLKDDTSLPSASLKDRAAAVAIARARQLGLTHLACASTGNAAASLAVLTARADLTSTIFVPAKVPPAKLAQLLLHGAHVVRVDGTYDQAFELSLQEIARHGWYSRNCAHNPLLVEGKKTCALELAWELMGGFTGSDTALPDVILVPTGDGCIVSSTAKAFLELRDLGWTGKVPRVYGVQAAGAAPLADAWLRSGDQGPAYDGRRIQAAVTPVEPRTLADSICVGVPRNRVKAWRLVASTGGGFLAVTDAAIVAAVRLLATAAGVFAEPSGATGLAGLNVARETGLIAPTEKVAVLITGHGLKDPAPALVGFKLPDPVPAPGR